MAYSRWGNRGTGHWYTYWCIQPKGIKETRDNAIFEICGVCSFTAKQLRDDIEKCINVVADKDKRLEFKRNFNPEASKRDRLNELKTYISEFLFDIEEKYPLLLEKNMYTFKENSWLHNGIKDLWNLTYVKKGNLFPGHTDLPSNISGVWACKDGYSWEFSAYFGENLEKVAKKLKAKLKTKKNK